MQKRNVPGKWIKVRRHEFVDYCIQSTSTEYQWQLRAYASIHSTRVTTATLHWIRRTVSARCAGKSFSHFYNAHDSSYKQFHFLSAFFSSQVENLSLAKDTILTDIYSLQCETNRWNICTLSSSRYWSVRVETDSVYCTYSFS